jgi:two-component system CheB/CheR fusion protein
MPVTQVQQTARLENNHVYVIAPDRRLGIADHTISALPFDEPRYQRAQSIFSFAHSPSNTRMDSPMPSS